MTTLPLWLRRHAVVMAVAALAWLLSTSIALAAGAAQDTYDPKGNLPFLYGVYTITWAAFFAYAFYVSRKQAELRRELEALRQALQQREGEAEALSEE